MMKKIIYGVVLIFALIGFGFISMYVAVKFGFTNTTGIIDEQTDAFLLEGTQATTTLTSSSSPIKETPTYKPWEKTQEWSIIESAIRVDAPTIQKAAEAAGVPARLIVAQLVVEQLRLFFSEREAFKKWFEPLKILGNQTQFSWGVMGMKETTAIQVEEHLKATTSPFYLGAEYEHVLDFKTTDTSNERFARMTDKRDHYYSYLYAGLFIKQILVQWEKEGYSLKNSPEVVGTLYNLGFSKSIPNPNPKSGGAQITIDGIDYSFGSLGADFYTSDALLTEFPR
jgi:hypothetical protein